LGIDCRRTLAGQQASCVFLGLVVFLTGCREDSLRGCTDLLAAKRYAEAVKACEHVYATEGNPSAGAAAAWAHYLLGRRENVLGWKDRLVKAGKVPPGLWSLAATVHLEQGKTAQAEQAYRREVAVSRSAGDHRQAADALYRLFYMLWGQASHRQVFLLASEAMQEAARAGDPDLEARAAQAVYTVLYDIGDLAGARRALEAARGLVDARAPAEQARVLNNLGTVLFAEGRLALARRRYQQALELGSAGTDTRFSLVVHQNLAEVDLELGEIEKAARDLARAEECLKPGQPTPVSLLYHRARLELARGRIAPAAETVSTALAAEPELEWAWQLQYLQGQIAEAHKDFRMAEDAYERSIATVEEMRRTLSFDELKAWLQDLKRQPFEALFRLQARSGRAKEALATADRAQARTFLDAFLHATSADRARSTMAGPSGSLERMEGLASLLPAMNESPVAALRPIDQVLSAVAGRHGLVYFEAGTDLWLFTVAGRRITLRRLTAAAAEIRDLGGRFLAHPEDASVAERLGRLLLPPGSLPEKGRGVYIVADGILGNLPFAALRRDGRYLVEDHVIVLVPSLSALAVLEGHRTGNLTPPLVLADPQGDLAGARSEAITVAKLLGGTALTADKATAGELGRGSRSRTLHLATHTGSGASGPWLQLADRRIGSSEVVAKGISPRLVVLASCSSGVRPGRQMWGSLGAAFLAAGSRAVLASLWSIEDLRAREFVLSFYREGGAADPSGALARAQRVAIARGVSPLYWGPFVLFGSDRPLDHSN
jgi:tetratricopeptide (TPR) repeat protein